LLFYYSRVINFTVLSKRGAKISPSKYVPEGVLDGIEEKGAQRPSRPVDARRGARLISKFHMWENAFALFGPYMKR